MEKPHPENCIAENNGELCASCKAALAALPVYQFTCPDCGGHDLDVDCPFGLVEWMTCTGCGYRRHGQSGRVEHGDK